MGHARYVGRVGALAVALGVGAAVATLPGVAWAEETGEGNASVDGAPANPEPASAPEDEGKDGGGDPGDPNGATGATTTTTTTTGNQSTTVIGGGGSPQVTISGSTVDLSGATTEQTPESGAPTTVEATPTATVEPTSPPQPTYTPEPPPSPVPAPISSTVPDPPATVPGSDEQELNAGEGDPQDLLDGQGDPSGTMKITAFDSGVDPGVGQYNLRMAGPTGVDDPQNVMMAADFSTGSTTLDAPAPPPPPDPLEALSVFIGSILSQVVNAVSAALAPIFGPGAPLYNSMIWGAIEAVRRQTNQAWANSTPVVDLQTTGQQDPDDREIHGTLGGSDPDGDALTYSVPTSGVGAPTNGTVTINATAGTWTYKPNTGYSGTDSFTITASDAAAGYHIHGIGQSHTGSDSITVTVTPAETPNLAPVANNDSFSTNEDTSLTTGNVLTNDTDPDGDAKRAVLVSGPANAVPGSFVLREDGTFTYTPRVDFNGSDSFTYKINDGALDSNTATVSITVNSVNDLVAVGNIPNAEHTVLSADGTIAYSMTTTREVVETEFGPNVVHRSGVAVSDARTGALIKVIDVTDDGTYLATPFAVSPDGSRLFVTAYSSAVPHEMITIDIDPESPDAYTVINRVTSTSQLEFGSLRFDNAGKMYVQSGIPIGDIFYVSVFDAATGDLLDTYDPGGYTFDYSYSPNGDVFYYRLTKIDGDFTIVTSGFGARSQADNHIIFEIQRDRTYTPVAVSPDGHLAYFVAYDQSTQTGKILAVDTSTELIVDETDQPLLGGGLRLTYDRERFVLVDNSSRTVSLIDASNLNQQQDFDWPAGAQDLALLNGDQTRAMFYSHGTPDENGHIYIVDTGDGAVINEFDVPKSTYSYAIPSPDGNSAYAISFDYDWETNTRSDYTVTKIKLATGEVEDSLPIGGQFSNFKLSADGTLLYITTYDTSENVTNYNTIIVDTGTLDDAPSQLHH